MYHYSYWHFKSFQPEKLFFKLYLFIYSFLYQQIQGNIIQNCSIKSADICKTWIYRWNFNKLEKLTIHILSELFFFLSKHYILKFYALQIHCLSKNIFWTIWASLDQCFFGKSRVFQLCSTVCKGGSNFQFWGPHVAGGGSNFPRAGGRTL